MNISKPDLDLDGAEAMRREDRRQRAWRRAVLRAIRESNPPTRPATETRRPGPEPAWD